MTCRGRGCSGSRRVPDLSCRVKARKRLSGSCQDDSCQVMSWGSRKSARPREGWLFLNLIMVLRMRLSQELWPPCAWLGIVQAQSRLRCGPSTQSRAMQE